MTYIESYLTDKLWFNMQHFLQRDVAVVGLGTIGLCLLDKINQSAAFNNVYKVDSSFTEKQLQMSNKNIRWDSLPELNSETVVVVSILANHKSHLGKVSSLVSGATVGFDLHIDGKFDHMSSEQLLQRAFQFPDEDRLWHRLAESNLAPNLTEAITNIRRAVECDKLY